MKKRQSIPKLKKKLQLVFNSYIRKRDKNKRCISCGQRKPLEAGHYYAVGGYDGLRFDEDNVHGECARCNRFDQSHLIGYGINLEKRIGADKIQKLHEKARAYKMSGNRWERDDLEQKIKHYKAQL